MFSKCSSIPEVLCSYEMTRGPGGGTRYRYILELQWACRHDLDWLTQSTTNCKILATRKRIAQNHNIIIPYEIMQEALYKLSNCGFSLLVPCCKTFVIYCNCIVVSSCDPLKGVLSYKGDNGRLRDSVWLYVIQAVGVLLLSRKQGLWSCIVGGKYMYVCT